MSEQVEEQDVAVDESARAFAAAFGCMTDPGWSYTDAERKAALVSLGMRVNNHTSLEHEARMGDVFTIHADGTQTLYRAEEWEQRAKGDERGYTPPIGEFQRVPVDPGKVILVTGGDDKFSQMLRDRLQEDDKYWRVIEMTDLEEPVKIHSPTYSPTPVRRLHQIATVILGGATAMNMTTITQNFHDAWKLTQLPAEWRWTDLHYHYAMQSGPEKEKRVQQRRKALAKLREKNHVKRGRSHAKQKHKGMLRYA